MFKQTKNTWWKIGIIVAMVIGIMISIVACDKSQANSETINPTESINDTIPIESFSPTTNQTEETMLATDLSTEPPHIHNYIEKVIAATCETTQMIKYICKCGDEKIEKSGEALGHQYSVATIKPTYTSDGYDEYVCSVCNHSYKDNYIDKIPHEHDWKETVTQPTCTSQGYTTHTCSVCGNVYKDTYTDKVAHKYGKYVSDNNETCIKDGTKTAACSMCGTKDTTANSGSKLGHSLSDWKDKDSNSHTRNCTRTDCTYLETAKHSFNTSTTVEPTCTEQGYSNTHCICGKAGAKTNFVDALGHLYGDKKTIAPTYTTEGYDLEVCNRCKHERKTNITPVVPHNCSYKDKVIAPTCTEKGYTAHICSICGDTNKDNYTDPIGHNYQQKIIAPTCTEKGYTKNTCSICQDTYNSDEVEMIGHDYKVTTVQATTGWAGYDLHKCTVCGHSYKDNEVPKLNPNEFPKGYSDGTCTIIIYKEWYENAYVYAAHVTFSDYTRLATDSAKGKYNSGTETTSSAGRRLGAILCINGDYATPGNGASGYAVCRNGVVCNDKAVWSEGIYNHYTGRLTYRDDIAGMLLSEAVAQKKVTDTFQFGPCFLLGGTIYGNSEASDRAQRTFIGTNGVAGDIWICVSDGRYNDGKSAGLNAYQCGAYLKNKGCTLGVPLDGGGSSAMYFQGTVLNAARGGERAVADFLYFK